MWKYYFSLMIVQMVHILASHFTAGKLSELLQNFLESFLEIFYMYEYNHNKSNFCTVWKVKNNLRIHDREVLKSLVEEVDSTRWDDMSHTRMTTLPCLIYLWVFCPCHNLVSGRTSHRKYAMAYKDYANHETGHPCLNNTFSSIISIWDFLEVCKK